MRSLNSKRQEDDNEILKKVLKGDKDVIEALYFRLEKILVGFIIKRRKTEFGTAHDIFHESFLILLSNIQDGKLTTPLKSTLSTYTTSIAINLMRNGYPYPKEMVLDPDLPLPEVEENPKFNASKQAEKVKKCMTQLSLDCQRILELSFIENFTPIRLAEELNISEGAAKTRKSRCLKRLVKLVNDGK